MRHTIYFNEENTVKFLIYTLFLSITTMTYSQDAPKDVVQFALQSLTNGDIQKLVSVTENSELRQVNELIVMMESSSRKKEEILNQYKNLKSWSIDDSAEHEINNRKIAVVNTTWTVMVSLEEDPKQITKHKLQEKIMKVDYMLEKFDGKWKIISRKAQS